MDRLAALRSWVLIKRELSALINQALTAFFYDEGIAGNALAKRTLVA